MGKRQALLVGDAAKTQSWQSSLQADGWQCEVAPTFIDAMRRLREDPGAHHMLMMDESASVFRPNGQAEPFSGAYAIAETYRPLDFGQRVPRFISQVREQGLIEHDTPVFVVSPAIKMHHYADMDGVRVIEEGKNIAEEVAPKLFRSTEVGTEIKR